MNPIGIPLITCGTSSIPIVTLLDPGASHSYLSRLTKWKRYLEDNPNEKWPAAIDRGAEDGLPPEKVSLGKLMAEIDALLRERHEQNEIPLPG